VAAAPQQLALAVFSQQVTCSTGGQHDGAFAIGATSAVVDWLD
jgi:hypothetical protein